MTDQTDDDPEVEFRFRFVNPEGEGGDMSVRTVVFGAQPILIIEPFTDGDLDGFNVTGSLLPPEEALELMGLATEALREGIEKALAAEKAEPS